MSSGNIKSYKRKARHMSMSLEAKKNSEIFTHGHTLPRIAIRLHGCADCDWKDNGICPFGFLSGTGHPLIENSHRQGICKERMEHLMRFAYDPEKYTNGHMMTYARWAEAYNTAMAQVELMGEHTELKQLEQRIRVMTKEMEAITKKQELAIKRRELNDMQAQKNTLIERWKGTWDMVQKRIGEQQIREMPKKLDINVKQSLSINDINRIVRAERVVDAKVVDDSNDDDIANDDSGDNMDNEKGGE